MLPRPSIGSRTDTSGHSWQATSKDGVRTASCVSKGEILFPLQPIVTKRPGQLVTMDIVEYSRSNRGSEYCLIMIDHFNK